MSYDHTALKQELLRRGFSDACVASVLAKSNGGTTEEATEENNLNHLHVAVWLEAVDPHHRYSKSLMKYFRYWQDLALEEPDELPDGVAAGDVDASLGEEKEEEKEEREKKGEQVGVTSGESKQEMEKVTTTSNTRTIEDTDDISGTGGTNEDANSTNTINTINTIKPRDNSQRVDFFSWLDFGGGRDLDLPWCPRRVLDHRRVKYMNIEERSWFEVEVRDGMLYWKLSGELLHTPWSIVRVLTRGHLPQSGTWIFVLSQKQRLYVGQKIKGRLHHSSFTAGAPTNAAGNIRVTNGKLIGLKPQSGHYRPDPEQWKNSLTPFLMKGGIDEASIFKCYPSKIR